MDTVNRLVEIVDILLGEKGCPWDKEQTMQSLEPFLQEELHELIEAIDLENSEMIKEEAGDLLHGLIFLAKIAEKEGLFSLDDVISYVCTKMIRRHPHIFGETSLTTSDEVLNQWQEIKKTEAGHQKRPSLLDGIPPTLPLLLKAQKMQKKISKVDFFEEKTLLPNTEEEKWGKKLFELIVEASQKKIVAEDALRRYLQKVETAFRKEEKTTGENLKA